MNEYSLTLFASSPPTLSEGVRLERAHPSSQMPGIAIALQAVTRLHSRW